MTWIPVTAAVTLLITGYLAAVILSLHQLRRGSIEARFRVRGRPSEGEWLIDNRPAALMALSLLRTCGRVTVFALILARVVGVGDGAVLTLENLLVAAGIAIAAVWLFTNVLPIAVAEHAGSTLIVASMPVIRATASIGRPISIALRFIDATVRRLSGTNRRHHDDEAEEELLRSIEETQLEGVIDVASATMLENVVEFRNTHVSDVMTPRADVEAMAYTDDLSAIREFITQAGHSRIPVYERSLDEIVGVLFVMDLVRLLGSEAPGFMLRPLLRQPIMVPTSKPVAELLTDFKKSEVHLAIVIDEYGGVAGLVTIEDVLEEIVGEIHDEHEGAADDDEPRLLMIGEHRAEADGRCRVTALNERLGLALPEHEDFDTIAGFILSTLGRVPARGEAIETTQARFEVLAATETVIERVGIYLLPAERGGGGPAGSRAAPSLLHGE
jgi:putative hemolysin